MQRSHREYYIPYHFCIFALPVQSDCWLQHRTEANGFYAAFVVVTVHCCWCCWWWWKVTDSSQVSVVYGRYIRLFVNNESHVVLFACWVECIGSCFVYCHVNHQWHVAAIHVKLSRANVYFSDSVVLRRWYRITMRVWHLPRAMYCVCCCVDYDVHDSQFVVSRTSFGIGKGLDTCCNSFLQVLARLSFHIDNKLNSLAYPKIRRYKSPLFCRAPW